MDAVQASSPLADKMLFVVGARRSGTLWLQRIVASHPEVSSIASETYLFSYGLSQVFDRVQHGLNGSPRVASIYSEREPVLRAARGLCDAILLPALRPGDGLLIERTPWHACHLDLIGAVYPDARFLHILRDGRDVTRSLVAQPWGPATVADGAAEWRDTVRAARAADLGGALREVRYEELLADPESSVRSLYEWLGLPATDETVANAISEGGATANLGPDATVSAGKWRREWGAEELAEFDRVAGDLLDDLGYVAEAVPEAPEPPSSGAGAGPVPERLDRTATRPQEVIEEIVGMVAGGRAGELAHRGDEKTRYTVVDGDRTNTARGAPGLAAFVRAAESDAALRGRQLLGEVRPGFPATTVTLVLEADDGARATRVLIVGADGERLTELTLVRPVPEAPGSSHPSA